MKQLQLWIYLEPNGKMPSRGKEGDAGLDCYADLSNLGELKIKAGQSAKIPLGFHYAFVEVDYRGHRISNDYYIEIANRSGFGLKEMVTELSRICDASYRGVPNYSIAKVGGEETTITHGQKICQALIHPFVDPYKIDIIQVDSLEDLGLTSRGSDGFGSTDK